MDRLGQLRGEAGGSRDSTLDTTSPPSESFMTANDSSKYFSLSEVSEIDSSFDISPIKDVSLASATESEPTITNTDELMNLSPMGKKSDILDSYKIGKQIDAEKILSGGVDIFDDNENSYDGDELVIDDNVELDEKTNDMKMTEDNNISESTLVDSDTDVTNKDTEVVLQIDGKNVDAIDIGNGLYLYRKQGQEELAAVQIIDDDQQQQSFKFLKVRENAEGNLEVYEEIEIEVPKEVPTKGETPEKNMSHVPINDISKVISDPVCNKVAEKIHKTPQKEITTTSTTESDNVVDKDSVEVKSDNNLNGKMKKFSEARKSPLIGSYTPMTFHSTPNKERIPLTKTMVDQQLHPSRHSDNVKKTIEVHTDSSKQRIIDPSIKCKDLLEDVKVPASVEKEIIETYNLEKEQDSQQDTIQEKVKGVEFEKCDDVHGNDNSNKKSEENYNPEKEEEINVKTVGEKEQQEKVDSTSDDKKQCEVNSEVIEHLSEDNLKPDRSEDEKSMKEQPDLDGSAPKTIETKNNENTKERLSESEPIKFEEQNVEANLKSDYNIQSSRDEETIVHEVDPQKETKEKSIEMIPSTSIIEEQVDGDLESNNLIISEEDVEMQEPNVKPATEQQDSKISECKEEKNNIKTDLEADIAAKTVNKVDSGNVKADISPSFETEISTKTENKSVNQLQVIKNVSDETQETKDRESKFDKIDIKIDSESPKQTCQISLPQETKKEDSPLVKQTIECKNETSVNNSPTPVEEKLETLPNYDSKQIFATQSPPNPSLPVEKEDGPKESVIENVVTVQEDEKVIPKTEQIKEDSVVDLKEGKIQNNSEPDKVLPKLTATDIKPINNNHAAVPFGQWTEANRQEFLNKIKEAKVPVNSCHSKQIKNSNDLNRRDVLKKIDSQRQSNIEIQRAKAQETNKLNVKKEITFTNKTTTSKTANQETKIPVKSELPESISKPTVTKKLTKQEPQQKSAATFTPSATIVCLAKKESSQRKELNTQDLIDQTIEGMLHKSMPPTKSAKEISAAISKTQIKSQIPEQFDDIEMKMNELHGIPFIERPPHELPQAIKTDQKDTITEQEKSKTTKIPKLCPFTTKTPQNTANNAFIEVDSEDEVIEHVPITGDLEVKTKNLASKCPAPGKAVQHKVESKVSKVNTDNPITEPIITEKDFDKFARRNSFTYQNCLTVNFDSKEPHNVIKTVIQNDSPAKNYSWNDKNTDVKLKSPQKSQVVRPNKMPVVAKYAPASEEPTNKNYQSKVQMAYQSFTAKRQKACPITIIEDKPVKVIFMDPNAEYVPTQLNVQGQELSPAKKPVVEADTLTAGAGDALDSELIDTIGDNKSQDEFKAKTKHQRKQVLTPVELPELEVIEPSDLGIEVSPKKKRKTDEAKTERNSKNVLHKKSYLLGRATMIGDKANNVKPITKSAAENTVNKHEVVTIPVTQAEVVTVPVTTTEIVTTPKNHASAIDNLVKAAELLETQSENANITMSHQADSPQNTPAKRGRGRPRKYPISEGTIDENKVPSPQKRSILLESMIAKSDTDDEVNSDGEIIKENWTMGKINENILCPICNKLFRSENVVFKHVKHCTGPSPNRSDSDTKSSRRSRYSQESDSKSLESKSDDMEVEEEDPPIVNNDKKVTPKKRKSRDTRKSEADKDDVIVIEDTPVKEKIEKSDNAATKNAKITAQSKVSSLVCEFCGKTFRQLSYLVSHKLQHKREESKKPEVESSSATRSVFSCGVCNKKFRKLHHLVQHRIIHNPMPSRQLRKSSEQSDVKVVKEQDVKPSEDLSAGFRCEPCDKSFRKLHHLVEHRETHDGINRQKSTTTAVQPPAEKPPQCDVCKKTFRKLHHLIEHKEQHNETSSEKSDDKSVKSLSTKDIIHECSLCYMVFPNEHSLTKHTVICQRKKRQSKLQKVSATGEPNGEDNISQLEDNVEEDVDELELVIEPSINVSNTEQEDEKLVITVDDNKDDVSHAPKLEEDTPLIENPPIREEPYKKEPSPTPMDIPAKTSEVIKDVKSELKSESVKIPDMPRKKTPAKDKVGPTVTKRRRTSNLPLPAVCDPKPVDSSDDEEVRYMLNPDFKVDDTSEGKIFMKVRAKKRNSLQIERPNSKDLVLRRISLQHPPKIPRLKPKPVEVKPVASVSTKSVAKLPKVEPMPYTDSDDSDVKYSFPRTVPEKLIKPVSQGTSSELGRKSPRKTLAEKRKSLSTIAKRKSLGKGLVSRQKAKPTPVKQIKRRTAEVEHRCDCGQLFSSAALLSRHTTLAHTPPRIRRRRSPPLELDSKTLNKPVVRKSADKALDSRKPSKQADSRKSSVRSDTSSKPTKPSVASRKSSVKTEPKTPSETRISKSSAKSESKPTASSAKQRRMPAHRGVPVPEKMRKVMNLLQKKK